MPFAGKEVLHMSKLVNEASIPALLEEMSVKEKVDLLVGKSFFSTQEMPKYGDSVYTVSGWSNRRQPDAVYGRTGGPENGG